MKKPLYLASVAALLGLFSSAVYAGDTYVNYQHPLHLRVVFKGFHNSKGPNNKLAVGYSPNSSISDITGLTGYSWLDTDTQNNNIIITSSGQFKISHPTSGSSIVDSNMPFVDLTLNDIPKCTLKLSVNGDDNGGDGSISMSLFKCSGYVSTPITGQLPVVKGMSQLVLSQAS